MITEIRERTIVRHGGKIEILSSEFDEGTEVEVVVRCNSDKSEIDETEYLFSTEANKEHLLRVIKDAEEYPDRKIYIDLDELKKDLMAS